MSQCSSCDGCKFRKECGLATAVDELSKEYDVAIIVPYCQDRETD